MMKCLALILSIFLLVPVVAEESILLQETVIYEGNAAVSGNWELAIGINTMNAHGTFDPSLISEGGFFTVEYSGSMKAVYLAFSEWQSGKWASVNVPSSCESEGTLMKAVFTFNQCYIQYGSKDFSGVDQICAGSTTAAGETTIHRIIWHGTPKKDSLGADAILFNGSATVSTANSSLVSCFTKHAGGQFDASEINPGARFYAEYSGTKNGLYLALSSHSGATQWARINAFEHVLLESGRYGVFFDYTSIEKAWGTNFSRLDQISIYSVNTGQITLHKLAYYSGSGEPSDKSDGKWDRPNTGIAFIGDSICQNALYQYGDWNTILDRTDCCNYGIGSQTTVEIRARIGEIAARDYRMVVFICGINDIGRGYTKEEIVANYDAMVKEITALNPECEFLLLSVLPTTNAFFVGQQAKINLLNMAFKRYASKTSNVTYVDTYSSFTAKTGDYAYPELLSDGLHPNRKGYEVIAEILKPYLD